LKTCFDQPSKSALQRSHDNLRAELAETKNRLLTMISLNADLQLDRVRLERALSDIMQSIRDRK
jgi:regulator of replication initiation timing